MVHHDAMIASSRKLKEIHNHHRISLRVRIKRYDQSDDEHSRSIDAFYPLNYGKETDACLWKAFVAEKVSDQCAVALESVNLMLQQFDAPVVYSKNTTRTYITVSIPIVFIFVLFLFCYLLHALVYGEGSEE